MELLIFVANKYYLVRVHNALVTDTNIFDIKKTGCFSNISSTYVL